MKRWEYLPWSANADPLMPDPVDGAERYWEARTKRLNELGKQGWELIAITMGDLYIFKREVG